MVELHIIHFLLTFTLVLPWSQRFFVKFIRESQRASREYAEDNLVPRDPRECLSKGRMENLVTRLMQMVQDPTLRR